MLLMSFLFRGIKKNIQDVKDGINLLQKKDTYSTSRPTDRYSSEKNRRRPKLPPVDWEV